MEIDTIRELLECIVCFETSQPPIYICGLGHSICNDCRFKVLQCPTCRQPYYGTRNLLAERLWDELERFSKEKERMSYSQAVKLKPPLLVPAASASMQPKEVLERALGLNVDTKATTQSQQDNEEFR